MGFVFADSASRVRAYLSDRGTCWIDDLSLIDPAVSAEICQRLAAGQGLVAICRDGHMPAQSTVYLWLQQDEAFRQAYDNARRIQADTYFDQIAEIADTPLVGAKTTTKADGSVERVEGDMIEHRRLQVETRKWMAGKLRPKKYGEATLLKHADADGNMMPDGTADIAARLGAIAAAIGERKSK